MPKKKPAGKKPAGLGPQVIFSGPTSNQYRGRVGLNIQNLLTQLETNFESANRDLIRLNEMPILDKALDIAKTSAQKLLSSLQEVTAAIMHTISKGPEQAENLSKMLSDTGSSLRTSFDKIMKGCDDYATKINNFDWSKISKPIKSFFSNIAETITKTLRNLVKNLKAAFNVELNPAAEIEITTRKRKL